MQQLTSLSSLAAQEDAPESRHRSGRSNLADLGRAQKTEVAVLQDSLSHLSMPQRPEEPRGPVLNPTRQLPALRARRQEIGYAGETALQRHLTRTFLQDRKMCCEH